VLVGNQVRVRRERVSIAQIQAQFDMALRLTSHALEQTRTELERAGVRFDE
jgi:flagellar basal body rod protein FlgB